MDALLAGAVVTVCLGVVAEIWGFRFQDPGVESGLTVIMSYIWSRFQANQRLAALQAPSE